MNKQEAQIFLGYISDNADIVILPTKIYRYILAHRNLGASAAAILEGALGIDIDPERENTHHPIDLDDFGRCEYLLQGLPELRKDLHNMSEVSPTWAALIARWDELEGAYQHRGDLDYPDFDSLLREVLESTK